MAATARTQFESADNMTDSLAALRPGREPRSPIGRARWRTFYARWQNEPLVVNKWFSLQAGSRTRRRSSASQGLLAHPAFSWSNPNRVRAVLGAFATITCRASTARDGAGYRLLADKALDLDPRNPQVAARLLSALGRWRRFDRAPAGPDAGRAGAGRGDARPVARRFEIASKSLA